jgi:predicted nuclease with TOPRIM domain
MEWVIALLGVGCVFFALQVVVDYVKYKRALEPKLEQMAAVKEDLKARIAASEAELEETRKNLEPSRAEVERLEREYQEIHEQIRDELEKQRTGWRPPPTPQS